MITRYMDPFGYIVECRVSIIGITIYDLGKYAP